MICINYLACKAPLSLAVLHLTVVAMTTSMRGMQAAVLSNTVHLIIGDLCQFNGSHFKCWAEVFALIPRGNLGRPET